MHPNGCWLFYSDNFDFSKEEIIEPCWIHRQDFQTGEIATLSRPNSIALHGSTAELILEHLERIRDIAAEIIQAIEAQPEPVI